MNVAVIPVPIGRVEGCAASHADDLLAVEEALEIRLANRSPHHHYANSRKRFRTGCIRLRGFRSKGRICNQR
jgi:hypothetical protein